MGLSLLLESLTKQLPLSLLFMAFIHQPVLATSTTITIDSTNLSAADFLPEFISQSEERRVAARLYLLGVLDSTEGKRWCSYQQLKTVTINEFVFEYLKKQSEEKLKNRASDLITEALEHHFPCKDTQ